MLLGLGEHYNRIVSQWGAERARALWRFIHDNNRELKAEIENANLDCELVCGGGFRLAETAHEWAELQEAAALLTAESITHQLHDDAGVARLVPAVGFCGMLELPGEAVVHPVKLVTGLARLARDHGARVYQHHGVTRIDGRAGDFRVHTDKGTVQTAVVAHCTSALARELDPTGFLERQVFPFRGQILATGPLPPNITDRFGPQAMSSHFCYEYFRLHGPRFVVGGMRWSVKGEEQGTLDDGTINPDVTANLLGYVRKHFPILRGQEFPHSWTGIMAGTKDGLPLLGALPGQPGAFALLGFNGYGLSFAYLGGRVLAQQILAGQADHGATPLFAPRRFQ
jgi:glycine/D-amino acid oxidase-like deaminating enzyme